MSPLLLFGLLLSMQEAPSLDNQVDELVEQLKDLSPDANSIKFLNRPAMSKLMAFGPRAFSRLKHHFLETEDWRLKASVGYLVIRHGCADSQTRQRWNALCKDPNLYVRMLMISFSDQFATGFCGTVMLPAMNSEERLVFDRVRLRAELGWMSPEDLKSLAINALLVLKEGKPLVDPPQMEEFGLWKPNPDPKRLRSSGLRMVTPMTRMAELSLGRISRTSAAHEAMRLVFECAEADDGTDGPRLGRLFRMASIALGHGGGCHPRNNGTLDCPRIDEYKRRLFALCEKWAWKVTDTNAQYGVLWALDYVGMWKSYDLRERLSKDHPDEQVRELAGSNLNRLWNCMYDRGYTRDQEAVDDRRWEESKKRR